MKTVIREMYPQEYPTLDDFLYEAIFQPEGAEPLPKSIIRQPHLTPYIENFGEKPHDICFCAEVHEEIAGAAWVRMMHGYGSNGGETLELAVSLYRAYRNQGIGTKLLKTMLIHLKKLGYSNVSLSVQKKNRALRLYQALGFQRIKETPEDCIMVCDLKHWDLSSCACPTSPRVGGGML